MAPEDDQPPTTAVPTSTRDEAAWDAVHKKIDEEMDAAFYRNVRHDREIYRARRRERFAAAMPPGWVATEMTPEADRAALLEEIARLRTVCAEAYQFAGEVGAPNRVLDNLAAAADGRPLPHDSFLPVSFEECKPLPRRSRS